MRHRKAQENSGWFWIPANITEGPRGILVWAQWDCAHARRRGAWNALLMRFELCSRKVGVAVLGKYRTRRAKIRALQRRGWRLVRQYLRLDIHQAASQQGRTM